MLAKCYEHAPGTIDYIIMQHPIEKLAFKDGRIFEIYNGKLSNPFMELSEIQVVKKLAVKERDQHQCEFSFGLSSAADPVWVSFFKEDLAEFPVEFQGDRLFLNCLPAELEERFPKAKAAIARTNTRYAQEREELIAKIVAKDASIKSAQQKHEARKAALEQQFDKFQI